ncbi:MAG: UvrB/UvrC motif-containing protein [Brevinema sp.]
METHSISVDQISILIESNQYVILFRSACGIYEHRVDMVLGKRVEALLNRSSESTLSQIMNSLDVSECLCRIKKSEQPAIAELQINGEVHSGTINEILPLAIEMGASFEIDVQCCLLDYVFDPYHEREVELMVYRETMSFMNTRLKEVEEQIANAVEEEQYEYAAQLRDQMNLLIKNKNN